MAGTRVHHKGESRNPSKMKRHEKITFATAIFVFLCLLFTAVSVFQQNAERQKSIEETDQKIEQ